MIPKKKGKPGLKSYFRIELWLFLLFLVITLFVIYFYIISEKGINVSIAGNFAEKTGGALCITRADDPLALPCLLDDALPPPGGLKSLNSIDDYEKVEMFLAATESVEYHFPLTLYSSALYIDKERKPLIRLFGIDNADLPHFFKGQSVLTGNLPVTETPGLVITGSLVDWLDTEAHYPVQTGASLVVIRNPGTYLDTLKLPVSSVVRGGGKALFADKDFFHNLSGVHPAVMESNTESGAAVAFTGNIVNKAFPVHNTLFADNFFFEVLAEPVAIGTVPALPGTASTADNSKLHYLVVQSAQPEKTDKLLDTFFVSGNLPLTSVFYKDVPAFAAGSAQLFPIKFFTAVFAVLAALLLALYLYRLFFLRGSRAAAGYSLTGYIPLVIVHICFLISGACLLVVLLMLPGLQLLLLVCAALLLGGVTGSLYMIGKYRETGKKEEKNAQQAK